MKTKIAKWGNSLGLRLPKVVAEAAGFSAGAEVDIQVEGKGLRLTRPVSSKHYRLEDLIREMDRLGPANRPELIDWGPDVGAEVIDDEFSRRHIKPPGRRPRLGRSPADAGPRTRRSKAGRRSHRH
jgi:antitoxin MazE